MKEIPNPQELSASEVEKDLLQVKSCSIPALGIIDLSFPDGTPPTTIKYFKPGRSIWGDWVEASVQINTRDSDGKVSTLLLPSNGLCRTDGENPPPLAFAQLLPEALRSIDAKTVTVVEHLRWGAKDVKADLADHSRRLEAYLEKDSTLRTKPDTNTPTVVDVTYEDFNDK